MKISLFFTFIVFQVLSLNAQNYQIIRSDRTVMYERGEILSVKTDSFKVIEGDTILHLLPNIHPSYYDAENERDCYEIFGPSFLGHQVVVKKDGDNLVFNKHNDTIKIKTQAKLGESWLAFDKPGSPKILAIVIKHDLVDVLGVMDSVKTIQFTTNDVLSEPLDDLVLHDTIQISKHFGIIKTIGFREFPFCEKRVYSENCNRNLKLIGYNNPENGVQNLTWFDVYDFQVGDVLHILYTQRYSPDLYEVKTILTILNRKDNIDSNGIIQSIEYTQKREIRNQSNADTSRHSFVPSYNSYLLDTITREIKANPNFDNLPGYPFEVGGYNELMYAQNQMYIGGFNNPPGVISKTPPILLSQLCFIDSCWTNQYCFIDGQQPDNTYYQGLGGPYYNYYYPGLPAWLVSFNNLVYFEKNDSVWGTPLDLTDVQEYNPQIQIKLYPNPASDYVEVQLNPQNLPATFQLFNNEGKQINSQKFEKPNNLIQLDLKLTGIFITKIINKDGYYNFKKLIVQ